MVLMLVILCFLFISFIVGWGAVWLYKKIKNIRNIESISIEYKRNKKQKR